MPFSSSIYLDHNATTPVREEVVEAVVRALRDFGNPSSVHAVGVRARAALETARARVAELVGAQPREIVFTAGATEANHAALRGVLPACAGRGRHLLTSVAEHPSVAEPLAALEAEGWRVTRLPVDRDGLLDPAAFAASLESESVLASILWANNETGVIQPLPALAAAARERAVLVHTDATQAVGKLEVDLTRLPVDLLSASGHKLNAPKGIGLLFVREGVALAPWIRGGPQERRRRGGTENVPGAVGLGVACALARQELAARAERTRELRDRLWEGLRAKVPRLVRNGPAEHTLPNTLNVTFPGCPADVLMQALDLEGVAVSAGAACASGSVAPSAVLVAMGHTPEEAAASLRFSLGHGNDEGQIDRVLGLLPDLVARVRGASGA